MQPAVWAALRATYKRIPGATCPGCWLAIFVCMHDMLLAAALLPWRHTRAAQATAPPSTQLRRLRMQVSLRVGCGRWPKGLCRFTCALLQGELQQGLPGCCVQLDTTWWEPTSV